MGHCIGTFAGVVARHKGGTYGWSICKTRSGNLKPLNGVSLGLVIAATSSIVLNLTEAARRPDASTNGRAYNQSAATLKFATGVLRKVDLADLMKVESHGIWLFVDNNPLKDVIGLIAPAASKNH